MPARTPIPPRPTARSHNGSSVHAPHDPAAPLPSLDASNDRDLALLHAHRAGDPKALSELLEAYQDRLFGVCLRMLGDPDEARDLTQDAMVRVIQGLSQFSGRSKLSTWMIRVAMNVCLTSLRRGKVRKHLSLDALESRSASRTSDNGRGGEIVSDGRSASGRPMAGEQSAADRVQQAEERRLLYRALDMIDPEHRAMLILRDMQGLDYRQIAEILDVPDGTVKSRLFRARAALRGKLETMDPRFREP